MGNDETNFTENMTLMIENDTVLRLDYPEADFEEPHEIMVSAINQCLRYVFEFANEHHQHQAIIDICQFVLSGEKPKHVLEVLMIY